MIRIDIDKTKLRGIENADKQVRFATNVATSRVAKLVREAEQAEIVRVFDQPTAFTRRGVLLKKISVGSANSRGNKPFVYAVILRDEASGGTPPAKYLEPQIKGGPRGYKRFERAFAFAGKFEGGEYTGDKQFFAVPGAGQRLNKAGNVTGGQINKILSALKQQRDPTANVTERSSKRKGSLGGKIFVGRVGVRRTLGIWKRTGARGRKLRPLFIGVKKVSYKKRFDFYGVGQRTVQQTYQREFDRALDDALRTAR